MKRIFFILILTAMTVAASAQYNMSSELLKKGGKLYQDGEKLSSEQITQILSPLQNGNGVSYDVLWGKARNMRTTGVVLTSAGSAAFVAGPVIFIVGLAKVLGSGIGSGIAGDPDGVVGEGDVTAGLVITGAGVAMLGSGIPLWCVGGKRMKNIVSDYNGQSTPEVSLAFGPCPNGLGLSLNF